MIRWSVGIKTEGDRIMEREEIVELADAVAPYDGIATGMNQPSYGAQLVIEAWTRDEAISQAIEIFHKAVATAGLPIFPIVFTEAMNEDEDAAYDGEGQ